MVPPSEASRTPVSGDVGFERMYREHYNLVRSYVALHYPHADTDDIVSATFIAAWRRFDEVDPTNEAGWLVQIAKHCASNAARSRRRWRRTNEAARLAALRRHVELHDAALPRETVELLLQALAQLSTADVEVLLLSGVQELSVEDLATALGVGSNAAAVRLHRARQRLAAVWGDAS